MLVTISILGQAPSVWCVFSLAQLLTCILGSFQENQLVRSLAAFVIKPFFISLYSVLLCFSFLMINSAQAEQSTTQQDKVYDKHGKDMGVLYEQSHALIIGVSDYTNGWPDLPGVKKDIAKVSRVMKKLGFTVTVVKDPDDESLKKSISQFINKYGYRVNNRLLFYFAGHGHTVKRSWGDSMGYILPKNTPNPYKDQDGFFATAMDMQQIEVYAKRIESKHVLFLFDSCFSGSLFALSRAIPEDINYKTSRPVRQFITSGSADEQVPDESVFSEQLVGGLNGEADANNDSYVTGVELGEFLQSTVTNYSKGSQHPQYGKIRHPLLDKGDFVFILPKKEKIPPKVIPSDVGGMQLPPPPVVFKHGNLQVNVNIRKADIFINNQKAGTASASRPFNKSGLTPGDITVRVTAGGYQSLERKSTIDAGQWTQLVFALQKKGQPAPIPAELPAELTESKSPDPVSPSIVKEADQNLLYTLTLRSNVNNDQVYINGELKGATRLDETLSQGMYDIRVEKKGYTSYIDKIYLNKNKIVYAKLTREQSDKVASLPQTRNDLRVNRPKKAYIMFIENGGFGKKRFRDSGKLTMSLFKKHLKKHVSKVYSGKRKQSTNQALRNARKMGAHWLVIVNIKHWEDRNSTWSGKKDRVKIGVKVLRTADQSVVKRKNIEQESGKFFGSNTTPQALLDAPVETFFNSLF